MIRWIDSVDSTNSLSKRILGELPSGSILAALEQSAGRGQRGNTWFSEPGKNLTFSLVLKFSPGELPARDSFRLNRLSSVAIVRFLQIHGVKAAVKWPNDIYVGSRKICGILIENSLEGEWIMASIVGVGLNVNQREFPQLLSATSLSLLTGKEYDLKESLESLGGVFKEVLTEDVEGEYLSLLFRKGVPSRYYDVPREREFTGIIEGVDPGGRLCILEGEARHYYSFKEVSFIL